MTSPPAIPAVRVTDICYAFGKGESKKQVLFDNQLTIERGEIVILTGPSGSGKTTLLTLIGALRSIQDGSIQLHGRELKGLDAKEQNAVRRDIGFIFQHHNLFDSLTAANTLKATMQLRADRPEPEAARQEAVELLSRLGLSKHVDYKPANLSGGQKQRVAIARALINRPRLILADEPTAALDKDSGRIVIDLFKERTEQGATVLIVTHDARILGAADRIVNMVDGHIQSNVLIKEQLRLCERLTACPLFKDVKPSVLDALARQLEKSSMGADQVIFRQDDAGDRFFIVDDGEVSISRTDNGASRELVRLGPGGFFGELALIEDKPRAATVTTTGPTQLLSLSKEQFLSVFQEAPSLADDIRKLYR